MRDDTGAPPVIPAVGSRLGTTPADTGGLATPLAPDHHAPAAPCWRRAPRHDRLCAAHLAPGWSTTHVPSLTDTGAPPTRHRWPCHPTGTGSPRPRAPAAAAPRHERLCAAHLAPGSDRPSDEPPCPPEQDRPCAASWAPAPHVPVAPAATAPGAERLRAAHLAPGSDRPSDEPPCPPEQDRPCAASRAPAPHVPVAPAATAPGAERLRAAHLAPGSDRPSDEPPCPPEQDRPCAASRAPAPHVPVAPAAAAPGAERLRAAHLAPGPVQAPDQPRAVQAATSASDGPHVTPPVPPAPDCSRRDAAGPGPRPTSVTDTPASDLYAPAFTAQERQLLTHTDHDSPLAAEVRLLRVLMLRLTTTPRRRRRRAGAAFQRRRRYARQTALHAICRVMDTLQRLLKTQHALASSESTELTQFLDDIAAQIADQPPPTDPPAFTPLSDHRPPRPRPVAAPPTHRSRHRLAIAPPAFTPRAPPTEPTPPPEYDRPSKYPHALLPPEPLDPPRPLLHTSSLLSLLDYDP